MNTETRQIMQGFAQSQRNLHTLICEFAKQEKNERIASELWRTASYIDDSVISFQQVAELAILPTTPLSTAASAASD